MILVPHLSLLDLLSVQKA